MAITYQDFLRDPVDLSPLGVIRSDTLPAYFCTPKGAAIFGSAGVDGIHYCFVDGFGEMVFVVSPMETPGSYVHPVAESFADFLRLLLACGGAAAVEQAWVWDPPTFGDFLRENPPTEEQRTALAALAERTGLQPMEDPWQYIHRVQSAFDLTRLEYGEEYAALFADENTGAAPPPWEVHFEGGFWSHDHRDRPGTEVPLGKAFTWAGRQWLVPAVYPCGRGLVVDLCMQVPAEEIHQFIHRWELIGPDGEERQLSEEERQRCQAENPLILDFLPTVHVNGTKLRCSRGCGTTFNPCVPEGLSNDPQAVWVLEHYGLDRSHGWMIRRCSFPWATRGRPKLKALSLTLRPEPLSLPGPCFQVSGVGDRVSFSHPETGTEHTLTVVEYEPRTLELPRMPGDLERPARFIQMRCTVSPALPREALSIRDCHGSDQPRRRAADAPRPTSEGPKADALTLIGGADGPVGIMVSTPPVEGLLTAVSSPRFEPAEAVEWRVFFHVVRFSKETVELLEDETEQ